MVSAANIRALYCISSVTPFLEYVYLGENIEE